MDNLDGLELYETEALVAELARRHAALLIVRLQKPANGDPDPDKIHDAGVFFEGGAITALGMATLAKDYLLTILRRDFDDDDDDE